MNGTSDQRRAPSGGGTGSLLGFEELLLGVGRLSAVVSVTEDRGEDGERGGVVEDCAEGNRRGLDRGEVCEELKLAPISQNVYC